MKDYWIAFLLWFVFLLVPAFLFVAHMQEAGYFDSIGLWYTIYCAVGFTLPVAVILALFGKAAFWGWGRLRR
jgi:hypothetical protein